MADLTNPFLNTSKLRSQLLADLSSDVEMPTPQSPQSVSEVMGVDQQANQVLGVTANIANNGGEFNPNDTTDYSTYIQSNPVEAWKDFQTYGKAALGVLGFMGMPGIVTGAISGAVQQNIANTFSDLIGNYVGSIGGVMADKTGLLEAAARGAFPGIGAASDQTSIGNLMNQFGSTDAAIGYFTAATDKNIGDIVSGMLNGAEVNSAEYGRVGSLVSNTIQSNIAKGMSYDEAVKAAQTNYLGSPILSEQDKFQNSVTEALSGMQNQITDLASSYAQQGMSLSTALDAAKTDLETKLADLSALYESQGQTQSEALNNAISDLQNQIFSLPSATQSESTNSGGLLTGGSTSSTAPDNIDAGGGWNPATTTPASRPVEVDVTFPTVDPNTTYVVSDAPSSSSGNGGFSYGDTSDSGYSADTGYSGGGGWSSSDYGGGWGGY